VRIVDATCSADSSTNTTDKLRERICAPYGPVTTLRLLDTKPATTGVPGAIYQPIRTDGGHEHLGLN
jgi:hypothetical protein